MFDETKVKAWTGGVPVEGEAVSQIQNITMLPVVAGQLDLKAFELPDSLSVVRAQIERDVPVGFGMHRRSLAEHGPRSEHLTTAIADLYQRFDALAIRTRLGKLDERRVWQQVGTLGGGNHFIELCLDESQSVWVMLHSGSRNIGNMIGKCAITMAREIAVKENRTLPDR